MEVFNGLSFLQVPALLIMLVVTQDKLVEGRPMTHPIAQLSCHLLSHWHQLILLLLKGKYLLSSLSTQTH